MSRSLTNEEAIERLRQNPRDYVTPETLRSLAAQVDADASGKLTVLYSGPAANGIWSTEVINAMTEAGEDVRVINKSQAAQFLTSRDFYSALAEAYDIPARPLIDGSYRGAATEWLYHATDGPWADASARFADATKGEVVAIVGDADPGRVFGKVEVPHILANPNVTTIEGIPRETLASMSKPGDTQAAFEMIVARAREHDGLLRVPVSESVNYRGQLLRDASGTVKIDSRDYFDGTVIEGKAPAFEGETRALSGSMNPPTAHALAGRERVDAWQQEVLRAQQATETPYAPRLGTGVTHAVGGAVVLDVAVEAYQWKQTLNQANTFSSTLGNETAAKEVLLRQGASSTGGAAGAAIGTGVAVGLGLGSGGTFTLVAAEAYFISKVADKAVTMWQHEKIYTQEEAGVKWKFNGTQWLSEDVRVDVVRDGVDNPQKQPVAAGFELERKLSYRSSVEAVEQQLGKVPEPRNPFEQPAIESDAYSARESPWKYSTENGEWARVLMTQEGDGIVKAKHDVEIANTERAAQLSAQALRTMDANIASGPAAIAAQYEVGFTHRGYQHIGPLPPAVATALNPDLLQASDEKYYQRDTQGRWLHEGEQATGQRALELELTRDRLVPMLQQHEQSMTLIPAWQAPTQEHLNQQALQNAYVVRNIKPPEGEQLEAAYAAVQRTRSEQGLPERITSLVLEADANGQFSPRSSIQHLQTGTDGAMRIAAITTAKEMDAIQIPSLSPAQAPAMKVGQPGVKNENDQTPELEATKPKQNQAPEASASIGPPISAVNASDRDDKRDDKQVVGVTTGLQLGNDFREKGHPGNAAYENMLHEVKRMETTNGIAHGPNSELVAAALLVKAEQSKFRTAEIVRMEPDGMVSTLKLSLNEPIPKLSVDPKEVVAQGQSFEKSTQLWAQARAPHYASDAPAAERTLDQVKALAQMTSADQGLFEKIRQNVPSHISDDVVAKAMLQAKRDDVLTADKIDTVAMAGDSIMVRGQTAVKRSMTDVSEPAAPMADTVKQTESFNQQLAIDLRLQQEQALAKKQEQENQGATQKMGGGMAMG
jgi:hypothetical protein